VSGSFDATSWWWQISSLLFDVAADDIEDLDRVRTLLEVCLGFDLLLERKKLVNVLLTIARNVPVFRARGRTFKTCAWPKSGAACRPSPRT